MKETPEREKKENKPIFKVLKAPKGYAFYGATYHKDIKEVTILYLRADRNGEPITTRYFDVDAMKSKKFI